MRATCCVVSYGGDFFFSIGCFRPAGGGRADGRRAAPSPACFVFETCVMSTSAEFFFFWRGPLIINGLTAAITATVLYVVVVVVVV